MSQSIAVIGAGITGLAAAYVLSSSHEVTIVARDLPGDLGMRWASPWAGAVFHPQKTTNTLHQAFQVDSFRFFHSLASSDPSSGVKLYPMTEYLDDRDDDSQVWYKQLMPGYRTISASELPPGVTFGVRYTSLAMNPIILLPWLKEKLVQKGVRFVRTEVKSIEEAREITGALIVVNASGVGAKDLSGDDDVRPVRGQTMFVKTDFSELVMREGSEYTYVIPRTGSGGVIMGGIKSDRLDSDIDIDLKHDILKRVNRITSDRFKDVDLRTVEDIIGFRPGRKGGLKVEKENEVIHAYGVEGAGYIYSFGIAQEVRKLIEGSYKSKL